MVTQRTPPRRPLRIAAAIASAFGFMIFFSACDKMPLLAPSGSVITIFPTATTVPLNGEVEIVATVIENGTTQTPSNGTGNGGTGTGTGGGTGTGTTNPTTTTTSTNGAGTPVQNGTLVTFTTTIGRIEPSEARTQNGQVRVKFFPGGQSGTAIITAFSGGASGKIENLRVGTAAVERVIVTANPQTVGPTGGTSEIQARVEDVTGAGLPGVPVNFIADAGTLSPPTANTDESGVARTTLNTSRVTKITANVGGKTAEVTVQLNPRTGISISVGTGTSTGGSIAAGLPATFTVNVTAPTTGPAPNIRDVTVDFGDGSRQSLGSISGTTTIQHTYNLAGTLHRSGDCDRGEWFHGNSIDVCDDSPGAAAGRNDHRVGFDADRQPDHHADGHRDRRDVHGPIVPMGLRRRHVQRHDRTAGHQGLCDARYEGDLSHRDSGGGSVGPDSDIGERGHRGNVAVALEN